MSHPEHLCVDNISADEMMEQNSVLSEQENLIAASRFWDTYTLVDTHNMHWHECRVTHETRHFNDHTLDILEFFCPSRLHTLPMFLYFFFFFAYHNQIRLETESERVK